MKTIIKNLQKKRVKAFTLVEMLIVLLIVSVLLLLFVPNLSKQKEKIEASGGRALVKVVESQAELFEISNGGTKATLAALVDAGFIDETQSQKYIDYVSKNNLPQNVPN